MNDILKLYKKILTHRPGTGIDEARLGIEPVILHDLLSKIGISLNEESFAFFSNANPSVNIGYGFLRFHSEKNILSENRDRLPGCELSRCGFFVFASNGRGDSYALDSKNGMIYLVKVGVVYAEGIRDFFKENEYLPINAENIINHANIRWPSLADFFIWALKELL